MVAVTGQCSMLSPDAQALHCEMLHVASHTFDALSLHIASMRLDMIEKLRRLPVVQTPPASKRDSETIQLHMVDSLSSRAVDLEVYDSVPAERIPQPSYCECAPRGKVETVRSGDGERYRVPPDNGAKNPEILEVEPDKHFHAELADGQSSAGNRRASARKTMTGHARPSQFQVDEAMLQIQLKTPQVCDSARAIWLHNQASWFHKLGYQLFRKGVVDYVMGVVIVTNSFTIGLEIVSSSDDGSAPTYLYHIDMCFRCLYTLELLLRFFVYGKSLIITDHWVQFDAVLVVIAWVSELIQSQHREDFEAILIIKIIRLAKMSRLLRFVKQIYTLSLLVQGLFHSAETLMWTFVVMAFLVYTFALVGMTFIRKDDGASMLYNESVETNFSDLARMVFTLTQVLTMDGGGEMYRPIIMAKPHLSIYFVTFTLIGSISLMNLVTATMVEMCSKKNRQDDEAKKVWERAQKKAQLPKLQRIFEALDADHSGILTLDEIEDIPRDVKEEIETIINLSDLSELFFLLDTDGSGSVSIDEFCDGIAKASSMGKPMELVRIMQLCVEMKDILLVIQDPSLLEAYVEEVEGRNSSVAVHGRCTGAARRNTKPKNTPLRQQSSKASVARSVVMPA